MTREGKLVEFLAKKTLGIVPSKTPDERFELYSVPAFDVRQPEIVSGAEIGSNKQVVEPGTVLLCKINPRINRAWVVGSVSGLKKIASTEWITFPPHSDLDPQYLGHYLSRSTIRDFLASKASGVGGSLMRVKASTLEQLPLRVPNIGTQRRVVAEIEKEFSRLDKAIANLGRVKANLKRYKAAVLKAAVEGRLVPTEAELAQREGRGYDTAEQLMQRIFETRFRNGNTKGRQKETLTPNKGDLAQLPDGWVWALIGGAFDVYVGATPSRAIARYWNGGIPWVSSGEVGFCTIKETRETISEEGLENSSTNLHPVGTVLLGMIGEGKTRGQAAILKIQACNNQNSAAIRVSETDVAPDYVYAFLEKEYEETRRRGSGGNQPALNKERVRQIPFPLPPVAEQHRIVAELDRRLSLVRGVEAEVEADMKRVRGLRQAIFGRAFGA